MKNLQKNNKIQELPRETVNKIAAGEVIERPASIIKELVENSIDADSNDIRIEIEEGGIKNIIVIDNGLGMSQKDAQLAYKLHTTSKIYSISDLEQILSFGFRGEALASIAAISEVSIHTKTKGDEAIKLYIENSELKSKEYPPRSIGTTIEIKDIFRHLPARKKFLRTANTEYRYILAEIYKVALRNPTIAFSLKHNDRENLKLPSTNSYKQRISDLFNTVDSNDLIQFQIESPNINIDGYLLHPSKCSTDRNKQFLFLNNRFIKDKALSKAIREGYHTAIPKEYQPAYFINISIDPSEIDINIHPKKLEVKINEINKLYKILKSSISKTLDKQMTHETAERLGNSSFSDNPHNNKNSSNNKSKFNSFNITNSKPSYSFTNRSNHLSEPKSPIYKTKANIGDSMKFTQQILSNNNNHNLYQAFQVFNTYIIIEKEDKLEILDQHAAHERINYERIQNELKTRKQVDKQNLLIPITIDLDSSDIDLIQEYLPHISKLGLDIDIFGKSSIKINALPVFAREIKHQELIYEILEKIKDKNKPDIKDIEHDIAASLACHGSIRAGRKMYQQEIDRLVIDFMNCKLPYSCPHGRPAIWELSKYEIEKSFKRII